MFPQLEGIMPKNYGHTENELAAAALQVLAQITSGEASYDSLFDEVPKIISLNLSVFVQTDANGHVKMVDAYVDRKPA
jgi:hypothetical protein